MRLLLLLVLLATPALARPWNGIEPGKSLRTDVMKKFGEPTKITTAAEQEVLVYLKEQAIRGTIQTQFRVDKKTNTVVRIDFFPEPILDKAAIEKAYGKECAPKEVEDCYLKRPQDKKPPYFLYTAQEMAIFFKDDGTVLSFAFLPTKKP